MLKTFASFLTYDVFKIQSPSLLGDAVSFFIYDSIKILLLLIIIIFIISFVRSYLPAEKIRNILAKKNKIFGFIFAGLFGIITPFCTCSAIPLFIGFIEAGIPLGITFTFLVASPMINEIALVMLFGLFGWKIALIYILSGLIIAIISGLFIEKFKLEHLIEGFVSQNRLNNTSFEQNQTFKKRIIYAKNYTLDIVKKVWLYILIGIGLGAFIHGYVPTNFLAQYASNNNFFVVPLVVLIGIPLYSNAAGVLPLVSVLVEKGVSIGTALAFMMAVTALSLPEFLILKKVMKTKLIIIFAAIVGVGIILTGYLFNLILR